MSNNTVKIGVEVVGTEKAKQDLEDVAEATRRVAEKSKAEQAEKGGLFGVDLTGGLKGLDTKVADATGYGSELAKLKAFGKTVGLELSGAAAADAALIAGSFAAIAASAVVAFKGVGDSLSDYKNLMTRWREVTGEELDQGSKDILAYAQVFEDIEQPIDAAIEKIGGFISNISEIVQHPLDSLIKLRKELDGTGDLEASIKRAEDAQKALAAVVQSRAEAGQVELAKIYGEEVAKLKEQEETLKRINNLRSELGSLEVQGARQEVESAKLRGGDVGLAEANVLSAQLRTGLAGLQQDLSEVNTAAATAQRQADAAMVAYQAAIRDKLDPSQITELGNKLDAAQNAASAASQAVTDQAQVFEASKTNLIRGAENKLANLEQEYDGKTSTAAKQAFDGIYQNLQSAFSEATSKSGEVGTGIDRIQTDAVRQADDLIGKTQQASQGIGAATSRLDSSIGALAGNVDSLIGISRGLEQIAIRQGSDIYTLKLQVQALGVRD